MFTVVLMVSAGCSGGQNGTNSTKKEPGMVEVKWEPSDHETVAQQVKKRLADRKEIKEVHVVSTKKILFAAVKFKTFDRFSSQQIVKRIEKRLRKQYPNRKVQVSSDKKVLMEIADLEGKQRQGKIKPKERKEKLKRIRKFLKEQ